MSLEYEIRDKDNAITIKLGKYSIVQIYYNGDNAKSPISREDAESFASSVLGMIEHKYPSSDVDEEEYATGEFEKLLDELGDDDGEEFLKMFMMGKLLGAI